MAAALPPALRAAIDAALVSGQVQRIAIAMGVRGLADRPISPVDPHLVRAEQCLGGRQVERMPSLDFYDRARIS